MSHVKNVEAFTRVVDFCTGFGGNYNPGRPTLQIDALTTQLSHIQSAMDQVKIARAEYDRHVVERKQAFDQVPKLLAGTLRRLEASGTKPEYLENARAHVHRFIGVSLFPAVSPASGTLRLLYSSGAHRPCQQQAGSLRDDA